MNDEENLKRKERKEKKDEDDEDEGEDGGILDTISGLIGKLFGK